MEGRQVEKSKDGKGGIEKLKNQSGMELGRGWEDDVVEPDPSYHPSDILTSVRPGGEL